MKPAVSGQIDVPEYQQRHKQLDATTITGDSCGTVTITGDSCVTVTDVSTSAGWQTRPCDSDLAPGKELCFPEVFLLRVRWGCDRTVSKTRTENGELIS